MTTWFGSAPPHPTIKPRAQVITSHAFFFGMEEDPGPRGDSRQKCAEGSR
jgi:hypothetical protein